jgi:CrcB protein
MPDTRTANRCTLNPWSRAAKPREAALHARNDTCEEQLMASLLPYLLVGVGGFIGANARLVVARLVGALFDTRLPLGTFAINVSGSFLLGILGTLVAQKMTAGSEAMRLALGVGFLGAFTTFSTFEFEAHALFEDGSWLTATIYIVGSVLVGLVAVRAGIVVAKAWLM